MNVPVILFVRTCDACAMTEERVFTDSWTGKELCLDCLLKVAPHLTNSPGTEGDNLEKLLREEVMDDGPSGD